jgi:hypothetical protein
MKTATQETETLEQQQGSLGEKLAQARRDYEEAARLAATETGDRVATARQMMAEIRTRIESMEGALRDLAAEKLVRDQIEWEQDVERRQQERRQKIAKAREILADWAGVTSQKIDRMIVELGTEVLRAEEQKMSARRMLIDSVVDQDARVRLGEIGVAILPIIRARLEQVKINEYTGADQMPIQEIASHIAKKLLEAAEAALQADEKEKRQ